MNNEEIKALLRELSDSADAAGRSRTVKITLDRKPQPEPEPEAEPEEIARPRREAAEPEAEMTSETLQEEKPKKARAKAKEKAKAAREEERRKPRSRAEEASAQKSASHTEESAEDGERAPKARRTRVRRESTAQVEAGRFETDADALRKDPLGDAPAFSVRALFAGRKQKQAATGGEETAQEPQTHVSPQAPASPEPSPSSQTPEILPLPDDRPAGQAAFPAGEPSEEEPEEKKAGLISRLRGMRKRTKILILVAAAAVLLALGAFLLVSFLISGKKSQNVATQEGLKVTVEEEPQEWVREAPVTLGIRASAVILDVRVNGKEVDFSGGKRTVVTVPADSSTLSIEVDTEEKTLYATAEIPMIDAEDPVVTVSVENGMALLDAVDGQSGVAGVWYGAASGFSDVPSYQEYTGAFRVDPAKRYYFFAKDNAGNMTLPVETTMVPAQSLQAARTQLTLFPNESTKLEFAALPEGSFVNGFHITSSDPKVASVDQKGVITALSNGQTTIEAAADGLPTVSCSVTVQSQAEITISAAGDVTMGEDVGMSPSNSFSTVYSMYGASHFFDNVRSIFSADDITFVNLEGTLTDRGERENKQFAFRGSPSYTDILTDGSVEAVTLANNHSRDYGEVSLEDTQKYLTEAGIDYCIGDRVVIREQGGVRVALIGIYVLDEGAAREAQVRSTIENAQEQGADIIVIAFHWGSENSYVPDSVQQSLAHVAIDCGAHLVVGHHPHVLQGIEEYNGKYIVYSLGNFCFGGNSNPSDKDTMIFQQTFRVEAGGNITGTSIHIVPCSISSETGWNNYQPTPAVGDEEIRIREKIREMSQTLGTQLGDDVF